MVYSNGNKRCPQIIQKRKKKGIVMNPNIIATLIVIGYIIITAVIMGLAERKQNDVGTLIAFLWPIALVALAILAVGYFPYKIAKGDFKRKNTNENSPKVTMD